MAVSLAMSSGLHPTTGRDSEIVCRDRDADKYVVQPCADIDVVRSTITGDVDCENVVPRGTTWEEIEMTGSTFETSVNRTPRTRTVTGRFFGSAPPPPGRSSGEMMGGGACDRSNPCEPMVNGVGLESKPCAAINRLVRMIISRGSRSSLSNRRQRSFARLHQPRGLLA